MKSYMDAEGLEMYPMLCQLYIEVCDLTNERYELGTQVEISLKKYLPEKDRW